MKLDISDFRTAFAADIARSAGTTDMYISSTLVPLRMLDNQRLPVSLFPDSIAWEDVFPVLTNIFELTSEARATVAPAIFAEFQEMSDILVAKAKDYPDAAAMIAVNAQGRGFDDITPPKDADDIWRLVRWSQIFVDPSFDGQAVNVVICGETAWDVEHEIGLFFRDGKTFLTASDPSLAI